MYEFLKMLLPVAEKIFDIHDVNMFNHDPYLGNKIKIVGADSEKHIFELTLTIKDHETSGEK